MAAFFYGHSKKKSYISSFFFKSNEDCGFFPVTISKQTPFEWVHCSRNYDIVFRKLTVVLVERGGLGSLPLPQLVENV